MNLQKDIPVQDSLGNYSHVELNGKAAGFGFNLGYKSSLNTMSLILIVCIK